MNSALLKIEAQRAAIAATTERAHKSVHGQFMTPASVATFMASLLQVDKTDDVRVLEPGAGIGTLASALLFECEAATTRRGQKAKTAITAVESDQALIPHLRENLARHADVAVTVKAADFVEHAVNQIQYGVERYTHAILNPPYKKIGSDSSYRKFGRLVGIETVNLYSLFVGLSVKLLAPGGSLVAIIPRSFCNGPYYRPFRDLLVEHCALERIHLFHSRKSVFSDDDVLQENIILQVTRDAPQGDVTISSSTDDTFVDLETHTYPFTSIIEPSDPECFIRVPINSNTSTRSSLVSLGELGLKVSTGPVVDFRAREYLFDVPEKGTVPLLYPAHFRTGQLQWPLENFRKANAIERNPQTQKSLFPIGTYVVTRRFSSKEERRRVVAHVLLKDELKKHKWIGFENHFNVFHCNKGGIKAPLARGLAAYVNSQYFDTAFRQFSGHTQVNATDLRNMAYPEAKTLRKLGQWIARRKSSGTDIDAWIKKYL